MAGLLRFMCGSEGVSCRACGEAPAQRWESKPCEDVVRVVCTCGLYRVYVCPVYFSLLLLTRDTGAPLSHVKWWRLFSL